MTVIADRLAQQYPDTNKEIGAAVVAVARTLDRRRALVAAAFARGLRRRSADRLRECEPASARARHDARTRVFGARGAGREPLAIGAASLGGKRLARRPRQRGGCGHGFLAG